MGHFTLPSFPWRKLRIIVVIKVKKQGVVRLGMSGLASRSWSWYTFDTCVAGKVITVLALKDILGLSGRSQVPFDFFDLTVSIFVSWMSYT